MSSPSTSNRDQPRDALASLRIDRSEQTTRRSNKRWLVAGCVVIVAALAGWFAFQSDGASDLLGPQSDWVPEIMQNRMEVRLVAVTAQKGRSADAVVVATGYLESRRQAKIGARAAGRINEIFFEEGMPVRKGDLLAELDHKDLDASLAAAVASVARAKSALAEHQIVIDLAQVEWERAEKLWNRNSIAESEYDQARYDHRAAVAKKASLEADIALAEAQAKQAEQLKENMFIRAPFDGTVISKDAEVGESILPGGMGGGSGRGSVATIADLEHLEIECDVQEDFISRVTEGQEAEIAVDAVKYKRYHGKVRKIIPMGDRARATIKVQVQIDDADELLFPEMAGTVYFLSADPDHQGSDETRIFCPESAVDRHQADSPFVWVVDSQERAQPIAVTVAENRDGRVEVLTGLQGTERVIVHPEGLRAGAPVDVVQ